MVFEALAYFLGFRLYLHLRRHHGDLVTDASRWWAITAAAVGGAIGSKALYWFEDPVATLRHWHDPAFLLAGKTIVGGLIGGLAAVEITKMLIGERRSTGDLFAVPLATGIAVGRIGCFLAGIEDRTYGAATALPWAVDFGDGVARHPTQLYEAAVLVGLAVALHRLMTRPHVEGDVFKLFLVGYLVLRLVLDALKPDLRLALGLSAIQWASLLVLLYYAGDIRRWLGGWAPSPGLIAKRERGRT